MSNERLRGQIAAAGLSIEAVAERVAVDPKTVERWITLDRTPHRRHRWATAELLGTDEGYLWPQVLDHPQTQAASQAEFVALYPHRGAVPAHLWSTLLEKAVECVDVLVYAGLFLIDNQPEFPATLAAKAGRGVRCRFLLGDPTSEAVALRGAEEGSEENLAARIRLTRSALLPIAGTQGVELRQHTTNLYNSLYRFDDDLLVNTHSYGSTAAHNPVIHIRRIPGGRLFDHYLTGFDSVWSAAEPLAATGS